METIIFTLVKKTQPGSTIPVIASNSKQSQHLAAFVIPAQPSSEELEGLRSFANELLTDDEDRWVAEYNEKGKQRFNISPSGKVAYASTNVPPEEYIIRDLNWFRNIIQ